MRFLIPVLLSQLAFAADYYICESQVTTNSSAPSSANCGAEGTASKAPFNSSNTATFNSCRDTCLLDNKCTRFSYNFQSGACTVYHASNIGFRWLDTSSTYFWAPACFVVPASAILPVNAITNGNFSSGNLNGWSYDEGNVTVQSTSTGSNYMQLEIIYPAGDNSPITKTAIQGVNLCQGASYTINYDFFQVQGGTVTFGGHYSPIFGITFNTPSGSQPTVSLTQLLSNTSATTQAGSQSITVPIGESLHISTPFTANAGGTYQFDVSVASDQANSIGTMGISNITVLYQHS